MGTCTTAVEYLDLRDLAEELANLRVMQEVTLPDGGLCEEDTERLEALEDLEGQLFNGALAEYARNESTLIPDEEFEDYAQEFAYNIGLEGLPGSNPLHSFIDWAGWAETLKQDYTEIKFDGQVYLIRAY